MENVFVCQQMFRHNHGMERTSESDDLVDTECDRKKTILL